jgi:hypothetical protein
MYLLEKLSLVLYLLFCLAVSLWIILSERPVYEEPSVNDMELILLFNARA